VPGERVRMRKFVFLVVLLMAYPVLGIAGPSPARLAAMDALWVAYTFLYQGDPQGLAYVEESLRIDPDLALANIIRAEFAMKQQDWTTARQYLRRGMELIGEPDQIFSPADTIPVNVNVIEANARVSLGYTLMALATQANEKGDLETAMRHLNVARLHLLASLELEPTSAVKETAENLLSLLSEAYKR
jgi:hypothetical protein